MAMIVFVDALVRDSKKNQNKKFWWTSFGGQVLGGPLEYQNKTCFGISKRSYQNSFYHRVFAMPLGLSIITLFKPIYSITNPRPTCLK
jgi:hypothetical protein